MRSGVVSRRDQAPSHLRDRVGLLLTVAVVSRDLGWHLAERASSPLEISLFSRIGRVAGDGIVRWLRQRREALLASGTSR